MAPTPDPALTIPLDDVQAEAPPIALRLSHAGITRSTKSLAIAEAGRDRLVEVEVACSVELPEVQRGAHMSRFEEAVNAAIATAERDARPIAAIATSIARDILVRQQAASGRVRLRATMPLRRTAPISGSPTEEHYVLEAIAVATHRGTSHAIGVTVDGMNACPCAQTLLKEQAAVALAADGFSSDEVERVLSLVPVATHNQRGRGTLVLGAPDGRPLDPLALVAIAEEGMSSEIYELMKRSDERYVVDRAHRRPRFVEDSVREMIRGVLDTFPDLPGDAFCSATQVNLETIHSHDVEASHAGTLGAIRAEVAGAPPVGGARSLDEWLAQVADQA